MTNSGGRGNEQNTMRASTQPVEKSALDELNEKEVAFVFRLTEFPRKCTISEAGVSVGYDERYSYRKAQTPKIQAAIREIVSERSADFETQTYRVLKAMGNMAEDGETDAAKIYLDAMGRGNQGVRIVNTVTATAGETRPLEDRIRGAFEGDKAIISEDS